MSWCCVVRARSALLLMLLSVDVIVGLRLRSGMRVVGYGVAVAFGLFLRWVALFVRRLLCVLF